MYIFVISMLIVNLGIVSYENHKNAYNVKYNLIWTVSTVNWTRDTHFILCKQFLIFLTNIKLMSVCLYV